MKKIGITGGVGSGKSKVLSYLAEQEDTAVYQADQIARELQMPNEPCYVEIVRYFGDEILEENGEICRTALAELIFQDCEKRKELNQIVHPAVNQKIQEFIMHEEYLGTQYFFLEAALLTEPFYREILDEIWFIYAEESARKIRLKEARGYTDEKITGMMNAQPSEEQFRECCDKMIDNTGIFENTRKQIDILLAKGRMQE